MLSQRQVSIKLVIEFDVMGERHKLAERGERLFLVFFTPLPVPQPNGLHALIFQRVFYLLSFSPFPRGMPWSSSALIMSPGALQQPVFSFISNLCLVLLTELNSDFAWPSPTRTHPATFHYLPYPMKTLPGLQESPLNTSLICHPHRVQSITKPC